MLHTDAHWSKLRLPSFQALQRPVFVRASELPPKSYFPCHKHDWDQLVYASSGVLAVEVEEKSFVIPPEQAVWLSAGQQHTAYSLSGAEFRSLYLTTEVTTQVVKHGYFQVSKFWKNYVFQVYISKQCPEMNINCAFYATTQVHVPTNRYRALEFKIKEFYKQITER